MVAMMTWCVAFNATFNAPFCAPLDLHRITHVISRKNVNFNFTHKTNTHIH